jgi:hypothetical protein
MNKFKKYFLESKSPIEKKLENFPKYCRRQTLSKFMVRHELFKMQCHVKGSIVECGVHEGGGLMTWANLSAIIEPHNYSRKIIGFDTFSGFPSSTKKDLKKFSQKGKFKENYNTYEDIRKCVEIYDSNRSLNHVEKVTLVKGNAEKTIPNFIKMNKHFIASLIWLDFDIYKPTFIALKHLLPRVAKGSIIAFDELNNPMWPGETLAALENNILTLGKLKCFNYEPNISYIVVE